VGRSVELGGALQQQLAQAPRQLAAPLAGGGQQLLGEEGLPSERERIASVSAAGGGASARASSSAATSSRWSGPSSTASAEPVRRTPSASRRIRSAEASSSAR
jgi:hypothetical protein